MVKVATRVVFGTAAASVGGPGRVVGRAGRSTRRSWSVTTGRIATATAARCARRYGFSKDWEVHEAVTYFTMYSYNFCWPVRTLREGAGRRA